MGMKTYEELKEMLCKELDEIADKGELSAGTLETVHKLTDTIKNIGKIEMLEGYDDDYSKDGGNWEARGRYDGGSSYARGGRRMGRRYSRDNMDDDYSMARNRDRMGRYSRDGGKEHIMDKLEDLIDMTTNERDRETLKKAKEKIENA